MNPRGWLVALALTGCGHRLNDPDAGLRLDGGTTDAATAARLAAVAQVAASDPDCRKLGDFVWEVGDATGRLGGGQFGTSVTPATPLKLASATKWLFGAYVVERFKADLSQVDVQAMTMRAGFTSFVYGNCLLSSTVERCFHAGHNDTFTASDVGLYAYNGGHFQKYAVDLGLGAMGNAELAAELGQQLGSELNIGFDTPQLAAGGQMTPDDYGRFLQKIVTGGLAMHDALAVDATCTLPGATCPSAKYSPAAPFDWHYGLGHWIEDEPDGGDGAFSSAGAFGFYPWVDASRTTWGLLARYDVGASAYIDSAVCGRKLRRAYFATP